MNYSGNAAGSLIIHIEKPHTKNEPPFHVGRVGKHYLRKPGNIILVYALT